VWTFSRMVREGDFLLVAVAVAVAVAVVVDDTDTDTDADAGFFVAVADPSLATVGAGAAAITPLMEEALGGGGFLASMFVPSINCLLVSFDWFVSLFD